MSRQKGLGGSIVNAIAGRQGRDTIALDEIEISRQLQPRVNEDENLVKEYAGNMSKRIDGVIVDDSGAEWPPLVVFSNGSTTWLVDGFHRYEAAKRKGLARFQVERHKGALRDALAFSLGVNARHGARRTNTDKRRVVMKALTDSEWVTWSNARIAQMCAVSGAFVGNVRRELEQSETIAPQTKVKSADGAVRNVSNIGRVSEDETLNGLESRSNSPDSNAQPTAFRRTSKDTLKPLAQPVSSEDEVQGEETNEDSSSSAESNSTRLEPVKAWREPGKAGWRKAALAGRSGQIVVTPFPRPEELLEVVEHFREQHVPAREYCLAEKQQWVIWSIKPVKAPLETRDLQELIRKLEEVAA